MTVHNEYDLCRVCTLINCHAECCNHPFSHRLRQLNTVLAIGDVPDLGPQRCNIAFSLT